MAQTIVQIAPLAQPTQAVQSPYSNLILAGYMGVGKVNVGRIVAARLKTQFYDLDTEIQLREGMPSDDIRQLFGESRLRTLESDLCRELALHRSSIIAVSGATITDQTNRERLFNNGTVLVLTCSLNEILRRLHASQGARFHDPRVRSTVIHQVRRERAVSQIENLRMLDTTTLTNEQVAEYAINFWIESSPNGG